MENVIADIPTNFNDIHKRKKKSRNTSVADLGALWPGFHNRIVCENWKMIVFRINFHIFIFARSVDRELSCNYELSSTGVIVS